MNTAQARPVRAGQISGISTGFDRLSGPLAPGKRLLYKAPLASGDRPVKDKIHPAYHDITVVMTDGTSFQTKSTYGEPGATMRLDIDPKTHPAWTGVSKMVDRGGRVSRFNEKFGALGRSGKK